MPGPYRLPALGFRTTFTASNKATYVAYRGPWAVETWVRERLLDIAARELGIGRDEIRLRNMIGPDELPRRRCSPARRSTCACRPARRSSGRSSSPTSSTGRRTQAGRAREGRVLGLGFATFIEAAPGPPDFQESIMPGGGAGSSPASRRGSVLEADGTVSVFTQQMPHGQGHETTLAQVAADELGVPIEQVRVRYGDTAITPFGLVGHGRQPVGADGRRCGHVLGPRVARADPRRRRRSARGAARGPRRRRRRGARGRRAVDLGVVRRRRRRPRPASSSRERLGVTTAAKAAGRRRPTCAGSRSTSTPGGCSIDRYVVVEDCGELINPDVVDGQVRGGVVQGIGAVLYEKSVYDDQANFQAGTFMDYLLPDRGRGARDRDPPRRDADRHRGQLPRRRRRRDDRRARRAHQRDRGRPRASRRAHHRAAPPADAGSSSSRA